MTANFTLSQKQFCTWILLTVWISFLHDTKFSPDIHVLKYFHNYVFEESAKFAVNANVVIANIAHKYSYWHFLFNFYNYTTSSRVL